MRLATLSRLELRLMQSLWSKGPCSIRELLETFPERERPAYTTVQTVVNRLEGKRAIRRVNKVSNAHVFEAVIFRASAQSRMIDELVAWFGGKPMPVMTHLIESGRLTEEEIREARKALRNVSLKEKAK
jgi:predicted transcriptional regulator